MTTNYLSLDTIPAETHYLVQSLDSDHHEVHALVVQSRRIIGDRVMYRIEAARDAVVALIEAAARDRGMQMSYWTTRDGQYEYVGETEE